MKPIKTGSDFSGVGAFEQSLKRLNIDHETVYACDSDRYARQTYIHNYGEPKYYPNDVYDREIPKEPLDIYVSSPPCQSFSLAGKRKGESDKRGILFYNSHEFIKVNKPRFFIFENVKGLLSDDGGKTFNRWLDHLGGKTINGNPVIFPMEESVPYHIYHKVLNAKDFGVPQNRERVFIIGIRNDADNNFSFPKPFPLTKRLKDVLESDVDEKYYLSDKMVKGLSEKNKQDNGFTFKPKTKEDTGNCVTARCFKMGADDNYIKVKSATSKGYEIATDEDSINFTHPDSKTRRGRVGKGVAQTLDTACNQGVLQKIENWYSEENKEIEVDDIIQIGQTNMKGKRIYKNGISPTLPAENPRSVSVVNNLPNTKENSIFNGNKTIEVNKQGTSNTITSVQKDNMVIQINPSLESGEKQPYQGNRVYESNGISPTLSAQNGGASKGSLNIKIAAIRGRNPEQPTSREVGLPTEQRLELNMNGASNALTTVQKDNIVVYGNLKGGKWDKTHEQSGRVYDPEGIGATIHTMGGGNQEPKVVQDYKIRRLTPRECFRLMDFPDSFTWPVSNSQAYKQAGNSIVIAVLAAIIEKLKL